MDKEFRKKFFLICLAGGILFAVPFFFGFGTEIGYPWYWALICLGLGLFFATAFYFVWIIVEKFQKPFSFENPKAQKKLLDYETALNIPYESKFSAHMHYGKGLKQEVCETCIYFQTDRMHIAFCHFGKIYSFDILYTEIDRAFIADENIFVINSAEVGDAVFSIKTITSKLKEILVKKGVYKEWDDLELIYKKLKNTYDLILTNTFALNDGYTIDVPVIRGKAADRRFDLYKEGDLFVFSVEFFDKAGEERYSHSHPYDVNDAIDYIEKFMSGKSIFD